MNTCHLVNFRHADNSDCPPVQNWPCVSCNRESKNRGLIAPLNEPTDEARIMLPTVEKNQPQFLFLWLWDEVTLGALGGRCRASSELVFWFITERNVFLLRCIACVPRARARGGGLLPPSRPRSEARPKQIMPKPKAQPSRRSCPRSSPERCAAGYPSYPARNPSR